MKQYLCIAQVYVDSLYLPGETIELTDEQAELLGERVELKTGAKPEANTETETPTVQKTKVKS